MTELEIFITHLLVKMLIYYIYASNLIYEKMCMSVVGLFLREWH